MIASNPEWATGESVLAVLSYPGLFCLGVAMLCAVLSWIVDMACVGTAVGYTYTCASVARISKKENNYKQMVVSIFGVLFLALFFLLNFIPGSPGFLSIPSFIMLGVCIILGTIFWFKVKNNFLRDKWEGVDVEHILQNKMLGSDTIRGKS